MTAGAASRSAHDMLAAALAYLDDEWSVFPVCTPIDKKRCQQHGPCKNSGKLPLVKWGIYQDRIASKDEIRGWWRKWPTANIGLATGEISGVDVVDLDGEVAQAEANRRGYESGPWVRTGRVGGRHLYFQHREDAPSIFAKVGGIDFRGQGGFVLLPPSLHWSSNRYSWSEMVRRGEPLPILPRWIDELASTGMDGTAHKKVDFGRMFAEGIPEGQRDQELFRGAAKLRGADVPYELAVETVVALGAKFHPPFTADESTAKVDSAYGRYTPNPSEPRDGHRLNGAELHTARFEPPRWAIPGILPSGLTILAGRPKLGKSWLALGWGLSIARAAAVMGKIQATPGEVLYMALEDGMRRMQERLALMLGDADWPEAITIETEWRKLNQGGLLDLELYLIEHPNTRMVVVDTFKRVRPEEKGPRRLYDFDYDAVAPIAALARRQNVAVVLVFHVRKGESDDPVDMVSGTLGLSGAADGVIVLRRERGQCDASLFITGRDVIEQELALKWEKDDVLAWTVIGPASQFRTSQARKEILDVLVSLGQVRPSEIADALGKNRGTVRQLLFNMTRDGELRCRNSFYSAPHDNIDNTNNAGPSVASPSHASRYSPGITPTNTTTHTLAPNSTTDTDVSPVRPVSSVIPKCQKCGTDLLSWQQKYGYCYACTPRPYKESD